MNATFLANLSGPPRPGPDLVCLTPQRAVALSDAWTSVLENASFSTFPGPLLFAWTPTATCFICFCSWALRLCLRKGGNQDDRVQDSVELHHLGCFPVLRCPFRGSRSPGHRPHRPLGGAARLWVVSGAQALCFQIKLAAGFLISELLLHDSVFSRIVTINVIYSARCCVRVHCHL